MLAAFPDFAAFGGFAVLRFDSVVEGLVQDCHPVVVAVGSSSVAAGQVAADKSEPRLVEGY